MRPSKRSREGKNAQGHKEIKNAPKVNDKQDYKKKPGKNKQKKKWEEKHYGTSSD